MAIVELRELVQRSGSLRLRGAAVAAVAAVAVAAIAASPQLLGPKVAQALEDVAGANPVWLWLAGLALVASIACTAAAWRAALLSLGGHTGRIDATARYGVGSLVNSFVPGRVGDAVRIVLFSQTLERRSGVLTTSGVFAAIGALRALALAALGIAAALSADLPLWPLALFGGAAVAAVTASILTRNRRLESRLAHLLDAFHEFGRSPATAARVAGWIAAATAARLAAAATIAVAYGLPSPVLVAVLIVAALDVAGLVPLTPGNWGVASGAIVVALQARGIGVTEALTVGIGFHAVETVVGIGLGAVSALLVAPAPLAVRRWTLVGAGGVCAASAVAVMVPNLV